MTRSLIWIIVLVLLVAIMAIGMRNYPGTVNLEWLSYRISMSIYLFAVLGLIASALLAWLWQLYRSMLNIPSRVQGWREDRREQRALAALQTATIALQEGRWQHTEKAAQIAARNPTAAPMAALMGASAAHARSDSQATTQWLNQLDAHPEFKDAKLMQQAQIALEAKDQNTALRLLEQTSPSIRKHSLRYQELMIGAQAQANNWSEVKELASHRKTVMSSTQQHEWIKRAITELSHDSSKSVDDLRKLYKDMPNEVREDDEAMTAYIGALINKNGLADARRVIAESMRNRWRPVLLADYVRAAETDSVTEQLKMCDTWTSQGHNDPALTLTTAQLCGRAGLWGQAKKGFEECVRRHPSTAAYAGLAQALRSMGDEAGAVAAEHKTSELSAVAVL